MGKVNNKDGLMADCWLDDEQLSKKSFLILRKLAITHQSKQELLNYLKEKGVDSLDISEKKLAEIKVWLRNIEITELENKLAIFEEAQRRALCPPPPPPPKKNSQKFESFISGLRHLCLAMKVDISVDGEGILYICDLVDGQEPLRFREFEDETTE